MQTSTDSVPARSIVVVHGVGDQERGQTARGLAENLVRVLLQLDGAGGAGTVGRRDDAACIYASSPAGAAVALAEVYEVGWTNGARERALPVHELYWADESRLGDQMVSRLQGSWQLFVGLPRLGLHALSSQPDGPIAALLRSTYVAAWVAMVVRMLVSLGLVAADAMFRLPGLRVAEISLPFDLAASLTSLAFMLAAVASRLVPGRWKKGVFPAVLSLTCATLLAQCVPLAVAARGPEPSAGSAAMSAVARPWLYLGVEGIDSRWFSAPNTVPGFWPYLMFGLVVVWGAGAGVAFLTLGLWSRRLVGLDPPDPEVVAEVGRRADRMFIHHRQAWWVLAVGILAGSALWDWGQLLMLRAGVAPVPLADPTADPQVSRALVAYCNAVMGPFVLLASVVLFSGRFRAAVTPLAELALDVLNYLPPLPKLDAHPVARTLLGGVRGPDRGALDEVLRHRLRGLIRLASERHGGPVLLVAHSLGSVIALTALDGWAEETGAAGESPPPPVDLVTMGSPLAMVAQAYPHLFGQERSGGRGWRLRAARSWANLYTSLDSVGRRLADTAPGPREGPPPQDDALGHGGHTGYFSDPRVARRLVERLDASADGDRPGPTVTSTGNDLSATP